jgi:predicted amidohydrolase YtcJ
MDRLILRNVELHGRRTDVVVSPDGRVARTGEPVRPRGSDRVIDGRGGALLPGLADRHTHLMGLAASLESVPCGPADVRGAEGFAVALRTRAASAVSWIRAVGYHESVAGPLDRGRLDAVVSLQPVRVQDRSGALWTVNSAGARILGLDAVGEALPEGVERDAAGRATGRLWRLDQWLRDRLGPVGAPDLGEVGRRYAAYGVTAVHDATPDIREGAIGELARAMDDGRLPQSVTLLGAERKPRTEESWTRGPFKLLPPDHDLWPYDELLARIRAARGADRRPVAVHCVTREALVLVLAALGELGPVAGDRIEHAAVVPPEVRADMRRLGLSVVTQPGFLAERGDTYLAEVAPEDVPHLYPYASLLAAGLDVRVSSDAPYTSPDPWAAVRAAGERRTPSGVVLNSAERVAVSTALTGMFVRPEVRQGDEADLCLLHVPWREACRAPAADLVRLTLRRGRQLHADTADRQADGPDNSR